MPKVSVIIPVYNTEQYLRECLDSVVNQTLKDIEIICVNDGSTDNSGRILEEYAEKDSRIVLINNIKNSGAPGTVKNIGISKAKGEYLSFVDSDDKINKSYLFDLYKTAYKTKADIIMTCNIQKFNNENFIKNKNICNKKILKTPTEKTFIIKNFGTNCAKLFKATFIKQNNLSCYEVRNIAEDNFFSLTSYVVANAIAINNKACYYYRMHSTSITAAKRTEKDFGIFEVYKQVDNFVINNIKDKKLQSEYLNSVQERKIQDYKWFLKECDNSAYNLFKIILKEKEPQVYTKVFYPAIISLTSYPARIDTVNQTIESILNQTIKVEKVILWLAKSQFPNLEKDLPEKLINLTKCGLTIEWCDEDIKSYKKLIPALQKYPDDIIVTADDDIIYEKDRVERLIKEYDKNKKYILCHRITRLYFDKNKKLTNLNRAIYENGKKYPTKLIRKASAFNKLTGCGMVLYPPHCFTNDVFEKELFMSLAPTSDDIWFHLQALRNGYKVKVVKSNYLGLKCIENTQAVALCNINDANVNGNFNKHLLNVYNYYPELKKIFIKDNRENQTIIFICRMVKLLNKAFTVKNSKNRANKVYTILGIKISIKRSFLYKFYSKRKKEKLLNKWYYNKTGQKADFSNPQTFNEKIQWMKLYDSTQIKTRLADKYLVREWVKEKIGEEYLIPLLGVWDKFDEIDFDKLPNQFVLKCNHGCGYNIIVKDKSNFDINEARGKINSWMREDFAFKGGFEMHYSDIPRKIIAEKYIENSDNDLYDYKVWCFNGKAHYVQFLSERNTDGLKMVFYDRNWNKQDFVYSYPLDTKENPKPKNLDLLLSLAERLSESFSHVRVDFYITNDGRIYFGEMTFTSCSGMSDWQPKSADLMLGQMIELNRKGR